MKRLLILIFVLLFLPSVANADYLVVSRSATLKSSPESGAEVLLRLGKGEYLTLLQDEQQNGYYFAQPVTGGPAGWIYRTLVRRHTGTAPVEGLAPQDPLADQTLHLTSDQLLFAARHLEVGKPQAVYERVREGYVTAVDARLKIPVWVQYQLSPEDLYGPGERQDNFHADTSIPRDARAGLSDYRSSGFDRGHMAPAEDMTRSQQVMDASFPLSNMSPQVGVGFNRHIWAYLEAAVRGWVEQRGTLTIITGPIFEAHADSVRYRVVGDNHVAVPNAFFKIVIDRNTPGSTEALAFRLPNRSLTGRHFSEFLTSIDAIEAETGLDFLTALPDDEERIVEEFVASNIW